MMELLRTWLFGITCAAMVLALAEHLMPDGGVRRIGKLTGGLVLIVAILAPVAQLDYGVFGQALAEYRSDWSENTQALQGANENQIKAIIAQQSNAYILDKAAALGIENCTVSVTCTGLDGAFPVPTSVAVTGVWTPSQLAQLQKIIEADFAILPEQQLFERTEQP